MVLVVGIAVSKLAGKTGIPILTRAQKLAKRQLAKKKNSETCFQYRKLFEIVPFVWFWVSFIFTWAFLFMLTW